MGFHVIRLINYKGSFMCFKRDVILFLAGALALHSAFNILFKYSGVSPVKMYGNLVNIPALLISGMGCIALLWWADKLSKEKTSFWKWW
jgi:hypothetical protein